MSRDIEREADMSDDDSNFARDNWIQSGWYEELDAERKRRKGHIAKR
jgi:hypothetical protein